MLFFSVVLDWMISHMSDFIVRKLFSDDKIRSRIEFSFESRTRAICCVKELRPATLDLIALRIHNQHPFPVALDHFECALAYSDTVLVPNAFLPLHLVLKKHSSGRVTLLPIVIPDSYRRVILNCPREQIPLLITGKIVANVIGKKILLPCELQVDAVIDRDT